VDWEEVHELDETGRNCSAKESPERSSQQDVMHPRVPGLMGSEQSLFLKPAHHNARFGLCCFFHFRQRQVALIIRKKGDETSLYKLSIALVECLKVLN
jgi:hypothetical protein